MPERFMARLARGLGYAVTGDAHSWFGPQQPLSPVAPPDVAGRQFDYPFGFNLSITPRSWEPTGFAELRALADAHDLLRLVIETRKDQMERLTWRIRKRGVVANAATSDPRTAAITAFFAQPDKVRPWASWLRILLEDLLVIDAPTLYLRRTRGGALWALEPLDGATIKRLIDDWGRTPAPPTPAYQQILKGVPAVDYTIDELIYAPRNQRVHKAYGYSPVEQVQMSVNIALRRQIYQLQYYTEGNIPEALIGVPDTWNADQIRQFQAYWDALNAGDTAERRHAKFVPGGVAKTFIPTREPVMKDVFDEWLARVICYAFSVPPSAFTSQVNRATAETAQETALAEGLAPLQNWVKQLVDGVIAREFQAPDLEFAWDQDKAVDPSEVAHIAASYVAAGIKSANEVRAELGLAPVPGGDLPQRAGGKGPADSAGDDAAKAATLLRFNANHYGPGPKGGQFAPAGADGAGGSPVLPVVYRPGNGHSENAEGPVIPVGRALPPRLAKPFQDAIERWLQRAGKTPEAPPAEAPATPSPEPPSTSPPKAPMPGEGSSAPSETRSPPSEEAPPGVGHNSPPPDEATPETPKPPPSEPYTLPKPKTRSPNFESGNDAASTIKNALKNGWGDVVRRVGEVVDAAERLKGQVDNIIADVDFSFGAPYDLQTLIDNAKGPSQAGYQDHHIVPAQRGTEDKGLSPEDEKRLEDPQNFVRIPNYVHQRITNYYYNKPDPDPPCNGQKPIDYLRDKNFDARYQFGLGVLRKFGVIK